ncbi:MAG: hypothetical protein ACPKQO_05765 [Nitrososphaeraceae archaeon]
MDYENLGKKILDLDSSIRLVTILNANDEKVLFSEHRSGVTNLLSKEESKESLQLAINAWKTRGKLAPKIGKGKYVLAEYEKIKRMTIPFDDNHLLYITTEVGCNTNDLINKIQNL